MTNSNQRVDCDGFVGRNYRQEFIIPCRRLAAVAAIMMVAAGCTSQDDPKDSVDSGNKNATIDAVFATWDVAGSPGCGLAVAQEGKPVYSRGYGYANLDYDIPITPQTVFDVASITKQFNTASLSMLALEGKLSLDDDVRRWLPELPQYDSTITLRHMINHTSGLRDYLNLFPLAGRDDYHPISHDQILSMMSRQRALQFQPGEQYKYSNTAYMLLAQVVERAGGKTFGEMTRERIFNPLGMDGSLMYENREEIIPNRAIGYDLDDDGHVRIVHNYNFAVAGDGQLYTTMEDLLRWDNYLHGTEKPAIHSMMLTAGTLNNGDLTSYAQGLRLDEYRGLRTVGHSGSSWGFRSELVRFLDADLSIAISCNFDASSPGKLAQQVADYYLADQLRAKSADENTDADQEDADPSLEQPSLSRSEFGEYEGDFFSTELDAIYRFTVEGSGLIVRIEQGPPLRVSPVAEDQFEFAFHPKGWDAPSQVSLEFERNPVAVTGFSLSLGSERGILFERM